MKPRACHRLLPLGLSLAALAVPMLAQEPGAPLPTRGEVALEAPATHHEFLMARFREELSPFGTWTTLSPYGEVWIPRDMGPGWVPYTTGHWAFAESCGWTWVADEPWGWIPFHYGRWFLDAALGWVWVPGDVWGPAWVAWRDNDDYVGWAPLPPAVGWSVGVGLVWGDLDDAVGLGEPCWCFVPVRELCHPHLHEVIVRDRRAELLRETHLRRDAIILERGQPVHHPIDVGRVERAGGTPVPRFRVREFDGREPERGAPLGAGELAIQRPRAHHEPVGESHEGHAPPPRVEHRAHPHAHAPRHEERREEGNPPHMWRPRPRR